MQYHNSIIKAFFLTWLTMLAVASTAQVRDTIRIDTSKSSGYIIMDADRSVFYNKTDTVKQMLIGNFKAVQDSTFVYADSAEFFNNKIKAMSNVVILQGDTVRLFCDSLLYDSDTMMAFMYDNVVLENGEQRLFTDRLVYNADLKVAYYYDTAFLQQGTSRLTSLKGVFDIENEISDYYEHVTMTDQGLLLRSDSLRYYNTQKRAVFKAPTRIDKDGIRIYCERGFYDIDDSIGVFKINAQFTDEDSEAVADTIYYEASKIKLLGNAYYISKQDTAYADVIDYNEKTGDISLLGNAKYYGESRKAVGEKILFNKETKEFSVEGRSKIIDEANVIEAEKVEFDKLTGLGTADGEVVFIDTSNHSKIEADHLRYRDDEEYFIAFNDVGKPVYTQEVDKDSMHISADTLKSYAEVNIYFKVPAKDTTIASVDTQDVKKDTLGKDALQDTIDTKISVIDTFNTMKPVSDTVLVDSIYNSIVEVDSSLLVHDTIKYIVADGNVEIFKEDLQAVCDTMAYNRTDSVFVLMRSPLMWSDSSQFSGDTIKIRMKNDEIDKVEILGNAMIISSTDLVYFSQLKGRRIDAYFVDSKIDRMVVTGNAQSLYYMQDKEDAYMGVNSTDCSRILILFENEEISDIKFYKENDSHILPMESTNHESIKLEGFSWQLIRRPLSPKDLRA